MSTYDRGSAPIPKPKEKIPPAPKQFTAGEGDDAIVQRAHELNEAAQKAQEGVQTQGCQPGFTAASVEGVMKDSGLGTREAGLPPAEHEADTFRPDEDGAVPDLPDEENVCPAPGADLPPGTVPLVELDE